MKKLVVLSTLVLALTALAVMPYVANLASGTGSTKVVLDKARSSVQVYAPDESVTFSCWRNNDGTWSRIYPSSGFADSDTVYTAFAGKLFDVSNGGKFDVVVIHRATATAVEVLAQ